MPCSIIEMQETPRITPRQTIRGHTDHVRGVAHLPGGQCIITGSWDGSLRLWDLEDGTQIGDDWRDEGDEARVYTIALSPNSNTVASGCSDETVRFWDVETRKVVAKWTGHIDQVHSLCWSPDGERVVSGSLSGMAKVWDVESRKPALTIKNGLELVYVVIYSPDSTRIAMGGLILKENVARIWDAKTGEPLATLKHDKDVFSLAWTSDREKLISGSDDGRIRIFNTAHWQQIAILEGHTEAVNGITLFRNNRLLVSASRDNTVRLWNLDTNFPVGQPLQHEDDVHCATFSADGKVLITGCDDKNAYVWDIYSAILKEAGLEDLLFIPNVAAGKSIMDSDATRRPAQLKDARRLPPGFFDDVRRDGVRSSATPHSLSSPQQRTTWRSIFRHGPRAKPLVVEVTCQPGRGRPIQRQQQ